MLLRELQLLLGRVYGIDVPGDVNDFLVTDPAFAEKLVGRQGSAQAEEKLLLREVHDELQVALFLHADILDRLDASDPRALLHRGNLGDFCTVIEGVSHFNYLLWNANLNKRVTLLEMEMQAEVDKYVSTRVFLHHQAGEQSWPRIIPHLFEHVRFHEDLQETEVERYRNASFLAGRYCHSLEARFPRDRMVSDMMLELREFFRLPQPDKVSHIQSTQFR